MFNSKIYIVDFTFIVTIFLTAYLNYNSSDYSKQDNRCLKVDQTAVVTLKNDNNFNNNYVDFEAIDNQKEKEYGEENLVPNIFHFLTLLTDNKSNNNNSKELTYENYMSIMSVVYTQNPSMIYLHYAYFSSSPSLTVRAIQDSKYWRMLLRNPRVSRLLRVHLIEHHSKQSVFNQKVSSPQSVYDVLRLELLMHYGGIFLSDKSWSKNHNHVLLSSSLQPFRKYEMTLFVNKSSNNIKTKWQIDDKILIANKNARFLKAYYDQYRSFFIPNDPVFNSQVRPYQIYLNSTFLAHEATLIETKLDDNVSKEKNQAVLFKSTDEFEKFIENHCS
jgi:hypothetical protein